MCERAFTLIEMIGVIAIMAILAAVIAPNVVRKMQAAGQDAEETELGVLAEGLMDYVLGNRIIPQSGFGPGVWSTNISSQIDVPVNNISQNNLNCSRRYWFDPSTDLNGLSDNSAAYNQNAVPAANISGYIIGSNATLPANPRAMIISDMTTGCTANINSVADTNANFAAVWNQADPVNDPLVEGPTLKIARINFAKLFKTVTLQSANGAIISRRSYYNLSTGSKIINTVMALENNSHIFSVSYSSGGFGPTDSTALLDIGYTAGGNEFVAAADVTNGFNSGPVAVIYTSTSNISISSELSIVGGGGGGGGGGGKGKGKPGTGTGITTDNSGVVEITVEYNGEPQYKLEGQVGGATTINITTPSSPEIVSFNVIDGTTIYLYDQSWDALNLTANLLHSVVIKESEGFTYLPGPPASWIR